MKYKYIFHTKDEKFAITLTSNADIIVNKSIPYEERPNQNDFVSSPTEVVKVGEPLPNSDEINKALEKGELYKRGFKEGYKQAIIDGKTNFNIGG